MLQDQELNHNDIGLQQMVDMLYEDRFFLTLLGNQLTTKPSTAKVEKFMANQIKGKLKEMQRDKQIGDSL